MRTLKYTLGLGLFVLLFASCDDVDDTPPRLVDMKTEFVLPAPSRLTNAERDIKEFERIKRYSYAKDFICFLVIDRAKSYGGLLR